MEEPCDADRRVVAGRFVGTGYADRMMGKKTKVETGRE